MARPWIPAAIEEAPERVDQSELDTLRTSEESVRLPQGLRAFAHRDYRIFWFSQLISLTGTWMQSLAQSWLVLSLTNSPAALGLVGVFQFGPTLLLGIPAGVLVDRVPKRRLLQATQSAATVITGLLAVLVVTNRVQLWHIYAAALALGVITAADMPARQAFVVDLVGADDLMNAIALNSALFNTTRVLGPALAGVLLGVFGPSVCFVLNPASYVPVIAGLTEMRTDGNPQRGDEDRSPLERLRQGLSYVRGTPLLQLPIALVGLVAVFGMNFGVWTPLLARDVLRIGAGGFGLLMSSLGAGSLAGALTLAFAGRRPAPLVMIGSTLLFGTFEIMLGIAAGLGLPAALAMACMAGTGFAMSVAMALANTTVQTNSPDHLRGRVMSIYLTVFAGSTPLGSALAGFASDLWGAPTAVTFGGAVVAVAALLIGARLVRLQRTFAGAVKDR
jgi:MFS family permease